MSERLQLPLVLARELPEAERLLREAGFNAIEVIRTAPPRPSPPSGPRRVVRQRLKDGGVQLVAIATLPLLRAPAKMNGDA